MIIQLTEEQFAIFQTGSKITTEKGTYYFFPYWLKVTERENEFEFVSLDRIPQDLRDQLNEIKK